MSDVNSFRPRVFSPVVVLWIIVVGVLSFGGWLVLSAYAPDIRKTTDPGAHALSKSAIGYAALRELLTQHGDTVVVSRDPKRRPHGLLILTPGVETDPKTLSKIGFEAPELVILPKWMTLRDPTHPGWVLRLGDDGFPVEMINNTLPKDLLAGLQVRRRKSVSASPVALSSAGDPIPHGEILRTGPIESLQTLSVDDNWVPVLVNEANQPVLVRKADQELYVLADPDLMNTHGLANIDTASTAVTILDAIRPQGTAVVQDVTLNGFVRARSILKLAFEPPFLGLTLSAVAVALLMALHATARFGPARAGGRALALGAKALADNSAGLIRLAKREPALAPAYAAQVRAAVAKAVGAPRDLSSEALDDLLDRLGQARSIEQTSSGLTAQAREVRTHADLMRLTEGLNHWRTEMTRDRR